MSSSDIDRAIAGCGWHFFYLAGELHDGALPLDGGRAVIKALTKIARNIEENLNAMKGSDAPHSNACDFQSPCTPHQTDAIPC